MLTHVLLIHVLIIHEYDINTRRIHPNTSTQDRTDPWTCKKNNHKIDLRLPIDYQIW